MYTSTYVRRINRIRTIDEWFKNKIDKRDLRWTWPTTFVLLYDLFIAGRCVCASFYSPFVLLLLSNVLFVFFFALPLSNLCCWIKFALFAHWRRAKTRLIWKATVRKRMWPFGVTCVYFYVRCEALHTFDFLCSTNICSDIFIIYLCIPFFWEMEHISIENLGLVFFIIYLFPRIELNSSNIQ